MIKTRQRHPFGRRIMGVGLMILLFFSTCRKEVTPSYQTAANAQTFTDVSYGSDPKQKMDVYLPANRTSNTNVIIFIHGGTFIGGDKSEYNAQARYLAASGYAVLNVNYRLVNSTGLADNPPLHLVSAVKVKDQVSDISAVVDYAIANAKSWVISSKRIGIAGHSAGATLALLYGYDSRNDHKIQVIGNIAGSLDLTFTDIPNYQLLPTSLLESGYRYTGFQVDPINEQNYKDISPFYVANATRLIPTINVFPENNTSIGLPKQDIATLNKFIGRLNDLHIPQRFVFVDGADHSLSGSKEWQFALNETVTFFNENIK